MFYYGNRTDINQMLQVGPNSGPIVVDSIDRRAYWYDSSFNGIVSQSLCIGGTKQVIIIRIWNYFIKIEYIELQKYAIGVVQAL